MLRNGLQVDVRVLPPRSFGAALHYFTGSRDHNVHMRRRAQERGYKLSEYGLFRDSKRIAGTTEEELFAALGLPWIPPNCGRIAVRSRPLNAASCPGSSSRVTCKETCTSIRMPRTAGTLCRR